ncbi:unnamed protein product [Closterium sp. NIES-53]
MFKAGALTGEKLRESDTSWAGIFEEIPVKMANSTLVSTLVASLHPPAADAAPSRTDFDRLLLGTNPFLETNLGCLSDCMDDLSAEQQRVGGRVGLVALEGLWYVGLAVAVRV